MANNTDRNSSPWLTRFYLGEIADNYKGCHYLWGSAGAVPGIHGGTGGAPYRPGSVDWEPNEIDDPKKVMVWAASCSVQTKRICTGRFQTIAGGRPADPNAWDLNNYLAQLRQLRDGGHSAESWPSYFWHFTPRWARWMGNDGTTWVNQLVWGEDCRGIQHFDCIGFINYLFMQAKAPLTQSGNGGIPWFQSNLEDVSKLEPWPSDIVFRGTDHIGYVFGINGESVVSALDSVHGVVSEKYNAGNKDTGYNSGTSPSGAWSLRCRLRDNQIE